MTESIFVLTQQEQEQITYIRMMVDRINTVLNDLSDPVKDHIKYEIEVFKNESEYLTDLLASIQ